MNRTNLVLLAIAASVVASLAAPPAVAQPAATKHMQDAQRKAEQKARDTKKKSGRPAEPHKHGNEQPASAP